MSMKSDLNNKLAVKSILESLADKFLTSPKGDKLEKFAEFLLQEFSIPEIKRGLQDIQPGEKFPNLHALRSAIYPHRKTIDDSGWNSYLEKKVEDEKNLARKVLETLRSMNFSEENISAYISIWLKEVHGEKTLEVTTKLDGLDFTRPALLCLHAANYKSQRAIEIGEERLKKIKAMQQGYDQKSKIVLCNTRRWAEIY